MFIDIETTGLSHYYDEITIIGWSLGGHCFTLVKGDDVSALHEAFAKAKVMVTFNGLRFDQRFIQRDYPQAKLPPSHLDLMYLARRVGLTGGQKAIEQVLGIDHRTDLDGIDGYAAVLLWHSYLRGDQDALRRLIQYNRADIAAMGGILDAVLVPLNLEEDLFASSVNFAEWSAPSNWTRVEPELYLRKRDFPEPATYDSIFLREKFARARVVGIDLTGSAARPSGWCVLDGKYARTGLLSTDDEIVEATLGVKPDIVSIDSPLCLPFGRNSAFDHDPTREEFGIMRNSEKELKRRGVNVYPCLLPSMQRLTVRGMKIAQELRCLGVPVIESYPGAAQDIMRIPRKRAGIEWLASGLHEFGIDGPFTVNTVTHDELDAVTSALVGTFHLAGLVEELGSKHETPLIIPKLAGATRPFVVGVSGPIAAGKTTLARFTEKLGFTYTRFSQVIDDMLFERRLELNRANRQLLGAELNRTGRQRELATRTIEKVGTAERVVIDGLRFPEDHAYMVERFGFNFLHIYVDAPEDIRSERYALRADGTDVLGAPDFASISAAEVETRVRDLKYLAHETIYNDGDRADAEHAMCRAIELYFGESPCLSQS